MKRHIGQLLWLVIALAVLVGVIIYNHEKIIAFQSRPIPNKPTQVRHPNVVVTAVTPQNYAAEISGYGSASAHYAITLKAQVAGLVTKTAAQFESGMRIAKGTVLAQLDDSDYLAKVASARQILADAHVSLLEEQRQGIQAQKEWQASGLQGKPDSPLVLRQPQLAAAQATEKQAQSALQNAEKNLSYTKITAPFDSLVVSRAIAPGSYVQSGGDVATLYSTDRVEVPISLSGKDWQQLPTASQLIKSHWPVTLTNIETGENWQAYVLRAEQHLDTSTRQRALIVAVDHPLDKTPSLMAGTFLQATLKGRTVSKLWKLPSTALSQRGEIWYVTASNTLANFQTEPVFAYGGDIYIAPPEDLLTEAQRILVHPLSSYLEGMAVHPVERSEDD